MIPFLYRQIEESFFQEVSALIDRGESTVLVAPRFGGSRYALFRLHRILVDRQVAPVVYLRFARHDELGSATAIRHLVAAAVNQAAGKMVEGGYPSTSLLGSMDGLQSACGKPVVLFAANVDYLPFHLSSRLLEEVRTLDQAGKTIAVLAGEGSFYDLIYGPNSKFTCANQFVLQGLSLGEFTLFAKQYQGLAAELGRPRTLRAIWKWTSGNRHMLRVLLWELLERRARVSDGRPPTALDIHALVRGSRLPGPYGVEIFRHPARLVAHEPRCWSDLQRLILDGSIAISAEAGAPTTLELAGVAARKGPQLHFSSPWMQEYIAQHFDSRRWADLYARNGDWPQAFAHYAKLDADGLVQPATAEDRLEVELTVHSLNASLYATINQGTDALRRLFARGCRYVLGYQDVAFWVMRQGDQQAEWSLEFPEEPSPDRRARLETAAELLPRLECPEAAIIPVPEPWSKVAVAASIPSLRPNQLRAVVLSDFKHRTVISRERERLTHDLIGHFLTAYKQAVAVERDRERLAMRDQHVEVMNGIFGALGSQVLNVNNALVLAARGLRRLGYSRVLFCLVNPAGDRIQGELDDAEDARINVAKLTDWPLHPPKDDLQPYVIFSRRPKIVPDARFEPLANLRVVSETRMKALAIVPLLNQDGTPIGTVHVERKDGTVPSLEEVEDLLQFGRQLAIAIEQCERVNLLQAALDEIPEPVLIADRRMRVRFTNEPAASLLGLQRGWAVRKDRKTLEEAQLGDVWRLVNGSLEKGRRLVRQIQELCPGQAYRGVALAREISDWNGRTVGAMLHLQDLNYLYNVLGAFRLIAESSDTQSAMRAILEAAFRLGNRRGRLFLVDDERPERLFGHLTLAADGQILKDHGAQEHQDPPRRQEKGYRTWKCIEDRTAIVFCWRPDQDDGARIITPFGLEASNANPPQCPHELDKKPGDFWIDFPLIAAQETLGKLTVSCEPNLKPEDFHLLRLLSEMAAGLLAAFIRRERMLQQVEDKVLGPAAVQAMAMAAHNINGHFKYLPPLITRYRRHERTLVALKALNDQLEDISGKVKGIVARIKQRLGSVKPELQRIDLVPLITKALGGLLASSQWQLECKCEALEADADPGLLEDALLELVQNSREMIAAEQDLCVTVTMDVFKGYVRLFFRDNGPGVPEHLKVRIFEPFFSRRPAREIHSGLGLAFVQRVISAHAGYVREAGEPHSGALFLLTFPRFAEEADHVQVLDR